MAAMTKYTWQLEERDAIRILWFEYGLDASREQDAYDIFSHLYSWPRQKLSNVRDEWRTRGKRGKNPSWATIHDKPFSQYTAVEQARRHTVRLAVLTAAQNLNIPLTPIADAEAISLDAHAIATIANANAVSASAHAPTAVRLPHHQPPSAAASPQPPVAPMTSHRAASSLESLEAATSRDHDHAVPGCSSVAKGNPHSLWNGQKVGCPQVGSANTGTSYHTGDEGTASARTFSAELQPVLPSDWDNQATLAVHHPIEEEDVEEAALWMVHYIDLHPNELRNSSSRQEPRFHCARSLKFCQGEHRAFDFGGQVMRVVMDADTSARQPRFQEDVMVCDREQCQMCSSTETHDSSSVSSPTSGLAFVHRRDCRHSATGELIFKPDPAKDYETSQECRIKQRSVRFFSGTQSALVNTAVCVAASCVRCSKTRTAIPTAADYVDANQRRGDLSHGLGRSEEPRDASAAGRRRPRSGNDSTQSRDAADQPPAGSSRSSTVPRDKGKGRADGRPSGSGMMLKLKVAPKQAQPEQSPRQLSMVHFSDLAHRNDMSHRNAHNREVLGSRYQSVHSKKFIDDSASYKRGGQLYPVFFYESDDLPARFEDVIICWDRACEVCSPGYADLSTAPPGGLPFVHLNSDTYRRTHRPLDEYFFEMSDPLRGIEWNTNDIPRAEDSVIICNNASEKIGVLCSVCDLDSCRRCHEYDIDRRSDEQKAADEEEKKVWNARKAADFVSRGLPATGPNYDPQLSRSTSIAQEVPEDTATKEKSKAPKKNDGLMGPPPRPVRTSRTTDRLRMVHRLHLNFEDHTVTFEKKPSPGVFEKYFVAETSTAYKFGGPVYTVNFPDETTRDVMACTASVCHQCKRMKEFPLKEASRTNGEPFCHRRELVLEWEMGNDGKVDAERSVARFVMGDAPRYAVPGRDVEMEKEFAIFQDAGGLEKRVACYVCKEGSCKECDEWQDTEEE